MSEQDLTRALSLPATSDLDALTDPAQRIVLSCERAKVWLQEALAGDQMEQIIEIKSQAEAIRVYTVQKQLGRDAELAAAEIVRRAERCIGLAIERGRDAGTILRRGQTKAKMSKSTTPPASARDLIGSGELYGSGEHPGIHHLAVNVTDAAFDAAITEAKAEKNLSRANVARKVKRANRAGGQEWDEIVRLAAEGHTSHQIAEILGITRSSVVTRATRSGVTIRADRVVGKSRLLNCNRVLADFVSTLESLTPSIELIDVAKVKQSVLRESIASLDTSLRELRRFRARLTRGVESEESD